MNHVLILANIGLVHCAMAAGHRGGKVCRWGLSQAGPVRCEQVGVWAGLVCCGLVREVVRPVSILAE